MPRPTIEVADVIRTAGASFFECRPKWFTWLHLKVLNAILRCRTAALGGHVDACSQCGHEAVSYNSCRNRHCPKCQANARDRWLEAREKELLPTRYVHVVFTLPRQLSPLGLQNKREFYALLFRASAETLLEVARDPQRLGAEIGFFTVLHTWNQKLAHHALRYLGQYTHRVAISNHRLVALADGMVTFRWRDSAHQNKKRLMTLPVNEFLRRFLLHVLPPGFVRIRHFGLMSHRRRGASLPLCLQLLAESGRVAAKAGSGEKVACSPSPLWTCPQCGGPMVLIERLTPRELRLRAPPVLAAQHA